MDPLVAQITHHPFTELADVLRSQTWAITVAWDKAVREAMPQMGRLTFAELKDGVPQILSALADALASTSPDGIGALVERSPAQGLARFDQHYDVAEVMQEDRLLRAVVVETVQADLGRLMDAPEARALHAALDVMLQQAVVAYVNRQKAMLRAAAEAELKYLSFLSHDLNNNLGGVTLMLKVLRMQLEEAGGFAEATETIDSAARSIHDTVQGMRRLLEHERLRKTGDGAPKADPVSLHAIASGLARQFTAEADRKGVRLVVEVAPNATARSDGELIGLALQNLVGNAVKYSSGGTVRVGAQCRREPGRDAGREGGRADRWVLWVSDEGPGISLEHQGHIFEAFRRGDVHGQKGVGLGLAIASQAARLLGADLTVESEPGAGSTFRLALPAAASDAG